MMSINSFPRSLGAPNDNPAIQAFGNRLISDQSSQELLIEFLLIAASPKYIGDDKYSAPIPPIEKIQAWPNETELRYSPKSRLNIKLFSFIGASRLDSRHETHRQHYRELIELLKSNIKVPYPGGETDVLRTLENLFLGFQGAGAGRTWCAQSFLPICNGFLAGEAIWNESVAKRTPPESWKNVTQDISAYFSMDKHRFLACGGGVFYLQICNAFRQPAEKIRQWVKDNNIQIEEDEQDPTCLHRELGKELGDFFLQCPKAISDIAEFIDSGVESETSAATDIQRGSPRRVKAGWCAEMSWEEGYLFAVEILRILKSDLDLIERVRLMETACSLQAIRTLSAQSARYYNPGNTSEGIKYRYAISAPNEINPVVKRISQHTAKLIEKLVYGALRSTEIDPPEDGTSKEDALKTADRGYGGKLFISMAKRIGLIVPYRGPGARFTINEQILRLLVMTIVPPGKRLTYDKFKEIAEARYGFVFDADGFSRASQWVDGCGIYLKAGIDAWLKEMLDAAGLLIQLSDSCALVVNPANKKGE